MSCLMRPVEKITNPEPSDDEEIMAVQIAVTFDLRKIDKIRANLKKRGIVILQKLADRFIVSDATRSFSKQVLGNIKWKPRYPGQKPPYINVAGALQDLNQGSAIKARRFQNSPALMDTG